MMKELFLLISLILINYSESVKLDGVSVKFKSNRNINETDWQKYLTRVISNSNKISCILKCKNSNDNCKMVTFEQSANTCKHYNQELTEETNTYEQNGLDIYYREKETGSNDYFRSRTMHVQSSIYSMVQLPNDSLACGCGDGNVRIFDTTNWSLIATTQFHTAKINSIVSDSEVLITGSDDSTINVYSLNESRFLTRMNNTSPVLKLKILISGDLASGSKDGPVKIWRKLNGSVIFEMPNEYTNNANGIGQLANGNLAIATLDRRFSMWDNSGLINGSPSIAPFSVTVGTDFNHQYLIVGSNESSVLIQNTQNNTQSITKISQSKLYITNFVQMKNNDVAVSVNSNEDRSIKILDWNTLNVKYNLTGHNASVYALTLLRNGCLISGDVNGVIKVWQLV